MAGILNLKHYQVLSVEENEHGYHIRAETTLDPDQCPRCHAHQFVRFGRKKQLVRDLPIHGKPVGIYLIPSVFIASHAVALEHLPVVDDKRQMTDRADAYADLIQTFDNWQPCILNYFQHPVTNPYTESLNNLIRVMNRLGPRLQL